LFAVAYRMLGSASDAEDVLQDAYRRWIDADGVRDPEAFLVRVVTRSCLDELDAARRRRPHAGAAAGVEGGAGQPTRVMRSSAGAGTGELTPR
jgi:DNA-directed RNA polymerase specialized sigma24 family protein